MAKLRKNTIDWLFNHQNAKEAIYSLGSRNLTVIEAVYITSTTEEVVATYDKMIMYNSEEADTNAIDWMANQVVLKREDKRYLYFRFKRWN